MYGMGERARNYKVDAIEVLNGGSSQDANNEAKELAKSLDLPGTAGSDAHQVSELFSVYSKVERLTRCRFGFKSHKAGLRFRAGESRVNTFLKELSSFLIVKCLQ